VFNPAGDLMERYICIHAHFYQPPRENAWLEAVELQDSAYPYHDWNERVTAECYAPNSASRILDGEGRILRIVNNYSKISFNFGPTLLAWMAEKSPTTYQAILTADRESQTIFSGHGSALAQAYNHMILPLATRRDKTTQVVWGIRDFEQRFGRAPEGMWLPETAVDVQTLEILSQHGIKFTVLSPYQAGRARQIGGRAWRNVNGGRIDPSTAYSFRLPSGKRISLFFYDGPISRGIAFEDTLADGQRFAQRLLGAFSDSRTWPQLVHIATDGETYGHHRPYGDMALAYALHHIECTQAARLTNYGEYLEKHPPTHEVQIVANSSWSCAHGVERWKSDCGCNSGMHSGWNQQWRAPLREAFDWLRDTLAPKFEGEARKLFRNPWLARDAYIAVVLDRSRDTVQRFMQQQAQRDLTESEIERGLKLLEVQRHLLLMYTSCGWFFDDLSGIETVQVIQYAARAMQLARGLFGEDLEPAFLDRLATAHSNIPEQGDGRSIYERYIRPAMVDLEKVGAHYAVSSLFEEYEPKSRIYCYSVDRTDYHTSREGKLRVVLGQAAVASEITWESDLLTYGVLHLSDHSVIGGVRKFQGMEAYQALEQEFVQTLGGGGLAELVRLVEKNFSSGTYTLRLLFHDEQRKILGFLLEEAMDEARVLYRKFYDEHARLIRYVTDAGVNLPKRFQMAVDFTLNSDLLDAFSGEEVDTEKAGAVLDQVRRTGVTLDTVTLEFALRQTIERLFQRFLADPKKPGLLVRVDETVALVSQLPFPVRLWEAQNVYYSVMQNLAGQFSETANSADSEGSAWRDRFVALGEKLKIKVEMEASAKAE
jgi:alpha-amylase/alpha-mannosidase (GH57 family)